MAGCMEPMSRRKLPILMGRRKNRKKHVLRLKKSKKNPGGSGSRTGFKRTVSSGLCISVPWQSVCLGRYKSYEWGGLFRFVQSVYAHFGISLPRTSYEQRTAGDEISYAEAQPGDLILYEGHVGIYMGDGKIINAMNEAQCIVVCSATYTNIVAFRILL